MTDTSSSIPEAGSSVPEADASPTALFVGPEADFYLGKWQRMEQRGSVVSWNWPAFFFGPLWMAYRKMYLYAALLLGFLLLTLLVQSLLLRARSSALDVALNLVQALLMGMFANAIYRRQVTVKVAALQSSQASPQLIAGSGGVSWIAVGGCLILAFAGGFLVLLLEEAAGLPPS